MPLESVVESMASVIADIFGTRRELSHQNAAKEPKVRWNSPDILAADDLIKTIQGRNNIELVRRTTDTMPSFHGIGIGHHIRPHQHDRRGSVFRLHQSAAAWEESNIGGHEMCIAPCLKRV